MSEFTFLHTKMLVDASSLLYICPRLVMLFAICIASCDGKSCSHENQTTTLVGIKHHLECHNSESIVDVPQQWLLIQQSQRCCSEKMLKLQLAAVVCCQWKELVLLGIPVSNVLTVLIL